MSTPIEIVRAYLDTRVKMWGTQKDVDLDLALAAVLRDAERFQKMERAHNNAESNLGWARFNTCSSRWAVEGLWPLAELADKLKEGQ